MIGARWRPALRVAVRTARHNPGRTALVAALVAAPVLGTTFLDTAYRTANLDRGTEATRQLGAADGVVVVSSDDRVVVEGGSITTPAGAGHRDPATVDPAAFLPAGSRLLPRRSAGTVTIGAGDRTTLARATELAWTDPLAAGLLTVRSGRLPARPGELALSPALADRLGVGIGQQIRPDGLSALQVVGLAADPSCRSCQFAAGPPGWLGSRSTPEGYLVGLPAGTDPQALQRQLADHGLLLRARDQLLHPERWPAAPSQVDATLLAVVLLVAGLGLLEVVLLAGTAFAVAARRQVRDAAVVLANGGRRADVRRMLLAQGAVLGLVGAAAGVGLGVLAVVAARRPLEHLVDQDFGRLVVSPRDLAIAAAAGLLAGVAAAVVPAWSAARVPVVAALAGRTGRPARSGRGLAATAAVGVAGGLLVSALVAWRWAGARRDGAAPGSAYPLGMLLGFGLAMVSLTVLAPTLVGLAGRAGGRLALTGRLALRDAARHRHRTGPAVAAVMVAVAGSVAVAFAVASYDRQDRAAYQPILPSGWASVQLSPGGTGFGSTAAQLAAVRSAAAALPSTGAVPVATAQTPPVSQALAQVAPPTDSACPAYRFSSEVGAGETTARLLAGDRGAAALAAGKAVVIQPCLVAAGTVRVLISGEGADRTRTVPAVVLPAAELAGLPTVVLPDAVARRIGLVPQVLQVVVPTTRTPTAAEEDRARTALGPLASTLQVERGYGAPYLPGFVALMGGAGLVTLAGVAISVTLSAAEGRADLATLAAIGAPPRRRRGLAMAQAALVAGLGVGLGLLLGAAIGATIMSGLSYPLVVPWLTVLVVGLGVPALGVLAAGGLTRSRLPMVRRLT